MIIKTLIEGLGLGALLFLVCAFGIRNGAVGMVHLYGREVQDRCVKLGLTTHEKIRRNALLFRFICLPGYIAYVLIFVYAVNGAVGFFQLLAAACNSFGDESYRQVSYRRVLGRAHKCLDDSGDGGS